MAIVYGSLMIVAITTLLSSVSGFEHMRVLTEQDTTRCTVMLAIAPTVGLQWQAAVSCGMP